jgi:uncharacterized protein (DUF1015 family)
MARFEPFPGVRYADSDRDRTRAVTSPPYDVFGEAERARYAALDPHNVVRIDYPLESDGEERYRKAAATWTEWITDGVLIADREPAFYVYRMEFVDARGRARRTSGVIGALEVADVGSSEVLPHEQTTPKAKSDRLDLLRATRVNLSPVWGLVLGSGLSELLAAPGDAVAELVDEGGVRHVLERINDPTRIRAIRDNVGGSAVMIADGHHRYAVSRSYRDERGPDDTEACLTMTYVAELTPDQLSIEAIHRVIHGSDLDSIIEALSVHYALAAAPRPDHGTLSEMERDGTLRIVAPDGRCWEMRERPGAFDGVDELDSARLAHAVAPTGCELAYQHGVDETLALCVPPVTAVVLIRPVSIDAIRSTAARHGLMPPKSTFFTPKLRTGLVFRSLDPADRSGDQDAEAS